MLNFIIEVLAVMALSVALGLVLTKLANYVPEGRR